MAGRFTVEAVFTATDRMSNPLGKMTSRMDRMLSNTTRGAAALDRAMGSMRKGLALTAGAVGTAGVTAGAGMFALSRSALSVEEAMAKVGTVITPSMGSVAAALESTKLAALDWSKTHVQSVEEFLAANYNMSSAGLNSTQALAGTQAALALATATMGDSATAGNLLATVYNNMGNKAHSADQEMTRLADVLAKTQAVFQIADLSQLNESLKMGAPTAIQYGQSVEQLSHVLGALNTAGLQGSMAGTAYSAAMGRMLKASKALRFEVAKGADGAIDFVGTLGNIEKKFGNYAAMSDKTKMAFQTAFGDQALDAVSLLLGRNDELVASLSKVTNAAGTAAAQQNTIEAARGAKLQVFSNQMRASAIAFGDAILPVLDELRPEIDKTIAAVAKWTDANKGLVASEIITTVRTVRDNLPAIATGLERVGKGVLAFYAISAGVKTVQGAITVVSGVKTAFEGAQKAAEYFKTSGTAGNKALTAALGITRMAGIAAGHGLGEMRAGLNASKMASSINGVNGLLGKAGLLGAALGVGYALGTWLDHTFGFSKMLTEVIAKMTGLDDDLNKHGKRYNTRAEANAKFLPAEPRMFNAVPVAAGGRYGFDMMADNSANGPMSVSPQIVTQGEAQARQIASAIAMELEHRQTVDVNVTATEGTKAEVKQRAASSGSRLRVPASGRPRE